MLKKSGYREYALTSESVGDSDAIGETGELSGVNRKPWLGDSSSSLLMYSASVK